MAIKGNKGEWSEFYAFIKILTDGEMFAADKDLNILKDKFFTVLQIIRRENEGKKYYDISGGDGKIIITGEDGSKTETVILSEIKSKVTNIFNKIKEASKGTFEIVLAEQVMRKLHCKQIKASNARKADLAVVIHDSISPTTPELGFSIKSMLGSPSTLLNASSATNFIYEIINSKSEEKDEKEANNIMGASKVRDRAKFIYGKGGKLVFSDTESETFRKNLRKIDSNFPVIVAELLKCYYDGKGAKLTDLVRVLSEDKEFCAKLDLNKGDFEYKIKKFLSAIALGMTPQTEWDGITQAHGGYIIVKENGEVVCYHLYNRDEFEEYLYQNTKFDTPSTTRHKFGSVYKEDGKKKMKYNLQIRFLK
jgi:hypothetical protein